MLEYLKKSPFKAGIILLALITIIVGGGYVYFSWDNPLGEELDISTPTELVVLSSPTAKIISTADDINKPFLVSLSIVCLHNLIINI